MIEERKLDYMYSVFDPPFKKIVYDFFSSTPAYFHAGYCDCGVWRVLRIIAVW